MPELPLFDQPDEPPPQASRLAPLLRGLAEQGVYFGTSSWKYEGWLGTIYTPTRYHTRGKFSQKKFEAECLQEYAHVFPVVGGDFSFYQFPSAVYWQRFFSDTPGTLLFGLKVPEEITVRRWPGHARYGTRAGEPNCGFLDARVFEQLFARPLAAYQRRVAVLMFEFGTFAKQDFAQPADFFDELDPFLTALPKGFRYGIEVRNPDYLGEAYFSMLARHNVAHVFNAWTRMPTLADQLAKPGAITADFQVARALLPRGRSYEQAVAELSPYEEVKAPQPAARDGLRQIAATARARRQPAFLFVNNRLEGHAPTTIEAVAETLETDVP